MGGKRVSVVVRALNEEKWLGQALQACKAQNLIGGRELELVLVDSGSKDGTLGIAREHGCRVVHISRDEFTFGRSLNMGCEAATGDLLAFISAHCIPKSRDWLENLIRPIEAGLCDYAYGRQVGHEVSCLSERQVFAHYFGETSKVPQEGFFCNNANSAISKETWRRFRFDEAVTGLEDMVLGKTIVNAGGRVGYVAEATVVHIHEETLRQTRRRYYREALTMRAIMPEVHFHFWDMVKCFSAGVSHDMGLALREKALLKEMGGIVGFRFNQYWGTYRGHNEHRALSHAQKVSYYYPQVPKRRAEVARGQVDQSARAESGASWTAIPAAADLTRD
jgi:glycosyltransferase involved in cell wall biosynthesis